MRAEVLSSHEVRMQRYRVLAQEARMSAVQLAGRQQSTLTEIAEEWERLAAGVEAEQQRAVPVLQVEARPAS